MFQTLISYLMNFLSMSRGVSVCCPVAFSFWAEQRVESRLLAEQHLVLDVGEAVQERQIAVHPRARCARPGRRL